MLPTQILLNNFLYDLAQLTIPTDRVDPAMVQRPRRWDIRVIRDFMLAIGPISSVYDFVTFGASLWLFDAGEALFQRGWWVESAHASSAAWSSRRGVPAPPSAPSGPLKFVILLSGAAAARLQLEGEPWRPCVRS